MKNTRKHKKTRKHKSRGGQLSMRLDNGPAMLQTLGTMLGYGISAIIVGPLYILAELLNVPMTSLNNLSRKAFNTDKKNKFLHVPIHKLITGCAIHELDKEKFTVQKDMYIHNNVAVVSCDGKNESTEFAEDYSTSASDSFFNFFGLIPSKRKLRHYVFSLFSYIDNIRETDEGRKIHIQKIIGRISDHITLIKCYLIYRSMKNQCSALKNKKTVLKDEDVVNIVNPYFLDSDIPYSTRLKCVTKHFTKKKFDEEDQVCKPACDTCTFRNSFHRLTRKYSSMLSTSGCKTSIVRKMLDTYYKHIKVTKPDIPLPLKETDVIGYLDKFDVQNLLEQADIEDAKLVLEKFNTFMCKYDIIPTVTQQIQKLLKARLSKGSSMEELIGKVGVPDKSFFTF